jgi:methionine synthase I (cobalamin-dependent)
MAPSIAAALERLSMPKYVLYLSDLGILCALGPTILPYMNDGCASVEDMILAAYPNASDPKATNATTALTPKYQQFSMSDW